MICEKYLNLIDDLVEDEIDLENAQLVNSHILVCPQCDFYCKTLKREKEIYADFLFAAEPPNDLWMKFQARMESEINVISAIPEKVAAPEWKLNISRFFRLYPALGFAIALLIFGIGLLKFIPGENVADNKYTAENTSNSIQSTADFNKSALENLTTQTDADKTVASRKVNKISGNPDFSKPKPNNQTINKFAAIKSPKTNGKTISVARRKEISVEIQLSEQQLQLSSLEKETTQQMEKIELLLRSFRNARIAEDGKFYDVGYEKQQARRLLEKNVRLRRTAENYGTLYAEEILDKVEPFLLDIANLENNPSPEKVADIKERVKNQNIIASLQIY